MTEPSSNTTDRSANAPHHELLPNESIESNGEANNAKAIPPKPSHIHQRRTTCTIASRRSPAGAAAISRTELARTPNCDTLVSNSMAALKRPNNPTPAAPIQSATSLVRTTEQRMPSIWVPVNTLSTL